MRAGGPTGCADSSDVSALLDPLSLRHIDFAQVRIDGRAIVVVADFDDIAIAVLPAGELDDSITDRPDRRSTRGAVVDTLVLLPGVDDRVHTHCESRCHARELHRARQERTTLALSV